MDTSKILLILCCFILVVCLTLAISSLTVLRNAVEESLAVWADAEALVDRMDELVESFPEEALPVLGNPEETGADAFYLCEVNGHIAIYTGDGNLLKILDVNLDSLPPADREALSDGIHLSSWRDLIARVQDYTS